MIRSVQYLRSLCGVNSGLANNVRLISLTEHLTVILEGISVSMELFRTDDLSHAFKVHNV